MPSLLWLGRSLTLDTNVDVILGLLRFPSVVVGLREGVCGPRMLVTIHK
jgi:uncharacterized membrane protein YqaE (UPF0057 family)